MRARVQFSNEASAAIAKVASIHGLSNNAAIQLLCSTYAPLHLQVATRVTIGLDRYSRPTLVAKDAQYGHTSNNPVATSSQAGHVEDGTVPINAQHGRTETAELKGAARGLRSLRSSLK